MDPTKKALLLSFKRAKELYFDEGEDEEEEFPFLYLANKNKKKSNKKSRICIENYVEITMPRYTPDDFKRHFRLKRSTFEKLLNIIQAKLIHETGRPPVDTKKKLLSVIWLLSKQESFW